MSLPTMSTKFRSIDELVNYSDEEMWFCSGINFHPHEHEDIFPGCPPYIRMSAHDVSVEDEYFVIPKPVAYYASQHAGFTHEARRRVEERAKNELRKDFRRLLGIEK